MLTFRLVRNEQCTRWSLRADGWVTPSQADMKVNLIGMILGSTEGRCFDGFVVDDDGRELSGAESLHTLIMEYANVVNGGRSNLVVTSPELARPTSGARRAAPRTADEVLRDDDTGDAATCCDWPSLVEQLTAKFGISQDKQLAELLGVVPSQITNWRKGRSDLGVVTKLVILEKLGHGFARQALRAIVPERSRAQRNAESVAAEGATVQRSASTAA